MSEVIEKPKLDQLLSQFASLTIQIDQFTRDVRLQRIVDSVVKITSEHRAKYGHHFAGYFDELLLCGDILQRTLDRIEQLKKCFARPQVRAKLLDTKTRMTGPLYSEMASILINIDTVHELLSDAADNYVLSLEHFNIESYDKAKHLSSQLRLACDGLQDQIEEIIDQIVEYDDKKMEKNEE